MPSPVAGTVLWTTDPTSAAHWTDATARVDYYPGRGKANPAETFYFAHCYNTTGILAKIDLTTGATAKMTPVYTGTGLTSLNSVRHTLVSADGLTLHVLEPVGATVTVYSVLADGSSPTPFVATTTFSLTANGFKVGDYVPGLGGWLVGNSEISIRLLSTAFVLSSIHTPPGPILIRQPGRDRTDPARVLWGSDDNYTGGGFRVDLRTGHSVCLVGSGVTGGSGGAGADPYAIDTGQVVDITGDADGRVYYADGAGGIRRIDTDGGAVSTVAAPGIYTFNGGFVLLPTASRILTTFLQNVRMLS